MLKEKNYDKYFDAFKREIQLMSCLKHDNIVKVLGVSKGRCLRLVLEFFPLGALKHYLKDKKSILSDDVLYLFCTQICAAMHYLGNHKDTCIVHRDLVASNILVASEHHVKITDFGLAKSFGSDSDYYVVRGSEDTPYKWYAPECIRHRKFSREGDVWSFGVLMWEMFTYGNAPTYIDDQGKYVSIKIIVDFLEGGGRLKQSQPRRDHSEAYNISNDAYNIMQNCWMTQRKDRPSFEQVKEDCEALITNPFKFRGAVREALSLDGGDNSTAFHRRFKIQ
ncbi:tyrosine-protein kinase ZAP-70-like [Antedon mediterranea]|uniref:tyrosine-protein kinase ZAP-70-like n=1 Tax=Antedon mediterranea TaxID=105859 RepID=UPI003AF8A947